MIATKATSASESARKQNHAVRNCMFLFYFIELCVRDVGVAGSNPVTPTIDSTGIFISYPTLGVSLKSALVQIWCRIFTNC